MKKVRLILILCLVCGAAVTTTACADKTLSPNGGEEFRAVLSPVVTRGDAETDLEFSLHIFSKGISQQNYTFVKTIALDEEGTSLTFTNNELTGNEYRFLFLAGEVGSQQINLLDKSTGNAIAPEGVWANVRLEASVPFLSVDNYCGVTDMTGSEIKNAGTIEGTLKRFVGQPVYDIYRVSGGSVNSPVSVQSPDVLSVIDRVYQIDFAFGNLTNRIMFSETNELIPDRESTVTGSYTLQVETDEDAKTAIPQQDGIITEYLTDIGGSTRIYGKCLLPASDDGISLHIDFLYIDTILVCWDEAQSDSGHVHDKWCNSLSSVELNIPRSGLQFIIEPNKFTRHKIGIPCDRVIDVPLEGGFTIDTVWNGY